MKLSKSSRSRAKLHAAPISTIASKPSEHIQQLKSGFVSKLSFEVRILIYEQLVVDRGCVWHIFLQPKHYVPSYEKLALRPCISRPNDPVGFHPSCLWNHTHRKVRRGH